MSKQEKPSNKVAWGIIGAVAVSMGVVVVGAKYTISQTSKMMKETLATQELSQPKQMTAEEIAGIVMKTISATEKASVVEALEGKLAPWSAAQDGDDRVYGNPNARFSIVTFSDLECPFCKRFHTVPKEVVDAADGQVNYEFKHLPLDFHNPAALNGSIMAECIAKEKGNKHAWAFLDQYFQHTKANGSGVSDLDELGKGFGITSSQIAACKKDLTIANRITEDLEFASTAGVSGTPSSFVVDTVGGQSIQIGGAQGADVFANAIRSLIEADLEKLESSDEE